MCVPVNEACTRPESVETLRLEEYHRGIQLSKLVGMILAVCGQCQMTSQGHLMIQDVHFAASFIRTRCDQTNISWDLQQEQSKLVQRSRKSMKTSSHPTRPWASTRNRYRWNLAKDVANPS